MYKLFITSMLIISLQATAESTNPIMKGLIVSELQKFELAAQVPAMQGFNIRARKIIVPAGVSIDKHDHKTRAGIVYIESGEIVEYRAELSRVLKAGDSLVEDATTVHSFENTSDKDCVIIAFDLPRADQ